MPDTAPSLADLDAAQVALDQKRARQAAYIGAHPARLETETRLALEQVQTLTAALKASGLLPRTAHEELEARLDAAFPKARPKDIVTFENERYRRRVEPATRTAAGQVSTWSRGWTRLTDATPPDQPVD